VSNEVKLTMYKQKETMKLWQQGWLTVLVMALLLGFATAIVSGSSVAFAQAEAPASSTETQAVTPDEVNVVARELWCPLCSGVRLDACELKACEQMKDVIAIKLAEGEDTASIQAYFVEQYGPQVMGEPPREGFNWLAWILPAVALVVGGYFFWRTTQGMMQPASPLQTNQAPAVAKPRAGDQVGDEDEYTQKLEEELAKYG
jgi:cytochrome c-type biogenesis protein CcmH